LSLVSNENQKQSNGALSEEATAKAESRPSPRQVADTMAAVRAEDPSRSSLDIQRETAKRLGLATA
jgi:hypothetical protein